MGRSRDDGKRYAGGPPICAALAPAPASGEVAGWPAGIQALAAAEIAATRLVGRGGCRHRARARSPRWRPCSARCLGSPRVRGVFLYEQERVGWGAASVLLAGVMGASLVVFLAGWRSYRYRVPEGSPLTPLLQVVIAALRKRHLELLADADELYEVKPQNIKKRLLCHTDQLRTTDPCRRLKVENNTC